MGLSAWPLDTGVRNGYNVTVNKKGIAFFPFNSYVIYISFFFCCFKKLLTWSKNWEGPSGLRSSGLSSDGGAEAGWHTADEGAN